jgi:hypothetical protein
MQGDLINNFYIKLFFRNYSFVNTISEIANLPLRYWAL